MFTMIGGDGRQYGPVPAEELREWIRDHRANRETLIQPEGSTEWTPLAAFPEFAQDLDNAWPRPAPPPPPATLAISRTLGQAWMLLGRHFLPLTAATFLVWSVLTFGSLSALGAVLTIAMGGALHGGLIRLYLRFIRGQPATLADLFAGFGPAFPTLLLVWAVTEFVSEVGLMVFLMPGLVLKILWAFSLPLAADRGLGFWAALEGSRRLAWAHFLRLAWFMALVYLPVIIFQAYSAWRVYGHLVEILGPLGTWQFAELQAKWKDLSTVAGELGFQGRLVLLANLPFACAAMLSAYENLLGRQTSAAERSDDGRR
ncbi:MAG TPA: GYF domain-containing protein [Verrucomicrobiota bacterium]|nr:GYF domain-containing protein [Verrucomicrobiota bacterium]